MNRLFFITTILLHFCFGAITLEKVPASAINSVAKKIDSIIQNNLNKNQLKRNAPINDMTFLRRIYIDIIGRMPDFLEIKAFMGDKASDKRAKLVDKLLLSKGYESAMYNYYGDLLRVKSSPRYFKNGMEPWLNWLKEQIRDNTPWNVMAYKMISANGGLYAGGDSRAIGYYQRDEKMLLCNLSVGMKTFIASDFECAQCHDHPFDEWTQKQFYQLAAFVNGSEIADVHLGNLDPDSAAKNKKAGAFMKSQKKNKVKMEKKISGSLDSLFRGLVNNGTGYTYLPEDYGYDNGTPFQLIKAKAPYGASKPITYRKEEKALTTKQVKEKDDALTRKKPFIILGSPVNSRANLALWMVKDNSKFDRTYANRLWKKVFKIGLYKNENIIRLRSRPAIPELMDYLAKTMKALKYDTRQFLRVVYNTKTYQSKVLNYQWDMGKTYQFPGPLMRRLSGEEVWDSLMSMVVLGIDKGVGPVKGTQMIGDYTWLNYMYNKHKNLTGREWGVEIRKMNLKYNEYKKTMSEQEALTKILGDGKFSKKDKKKNRVAGMLSKKEARKLNASATDIAALQKLKMVRYSEHEQPASPIHLAREYGASDRDLINNNSLDPSLSQILSMMNGFIEQVLLRKQDSVINKLLKESDPGGTIKNIYLAILQRYPTKGEYEKWTNDFKTKKSLAFRECVWVLLNSNEFLFLR